jgi:AcrR family transcriptional regulator
LAASDREEAAVSRKPRADAERNRVRLLDAAKAAYADKGSAASLDEIARAAGVGIGTFYRHFPTRDALVEAVYRKESEALIAAATRLADARPPVEALREWLLLFVDYMAVKRGMQETLRALAASGSDVKANAGARLEHAIGTLVARGVASGDLEFEMKPMDLLHALAGVGATGGDSRKSARRLVEVLIGGMRTGSGSRRR